MLLKEPLVHFLVGAALVFVYFSMSGSQPGDDTVIVVTKQDIQRMQQRWQRDWRRAPDSAQMQQLIDEAVRDELLYREGLRLGLDRDDTVVRNRMIQKMRFLNDQDLRGPEEAELQAWLASDPQKYQRSQQFSFQQVYLGQDYSLTEAEALLGQLADGSLSADKLLEQHARPLSVSASLRTASRESVAREFGESFADQLPGLPQNRWAGPVISGYGVHLVQLQEIIEPPVPQLQDASVRQQVENDWRAAQRSEAMQATIETLRERYDVVIEQP